MKTEFKIFENSLFCICWQPSLLFPDKYAFHYLVWDRIAEKVIYYSNIIKW